jgi:hypothetical protein
MKGGIRPASDRQSSGKGGKAALPPLKGVSSATFHRQSTGIRPAVWGRAPGRRRGALGATADGYLPRPQTAGAGPRG